MTIICFSHLRWNFVFQRPQHLLTRFAKHHTIYFVEEPLFYENDDENIIYTSTENIHVVTPHFNYREKEISLNERQSLLLAKLLQEHNISNYIFWYYSPIMFL